MLTVAQRRTHRKAKAALRGRMREVRRERDHARFIIQLDRELMALCDTWDVDSELGVAEHGREGIVRSRAS